MLHSAHNDAPHKQCGICSSLSDHECAFHRFGWDIDNTYLPAAANHLKVVRDFQPFDSRKLRLRRCSECGTHYPYRTDYEYLVNGSEGEEHLTRLTEEQAAQYLSRSAAA
jgi:hypothetical protein